MLIARGQTRHHKELLILGLSTANRERLAEGMPISLDIGPIRQPLEIILFAGDTEDSMQQELRQILNDRSSVNGAEVQ